jgi:hypothetical protein
MNRMLDLKKMHVERRRGGSRQHALLPVVAGRMALFRVAGV